MPPFDFPEDGITDGGIVVRPHRQADVPAMVEACQDPSIPEFTRVPSPYTDNDAREWIALAASERREGNRLSLVIAEPGGDLLGSIGMFDFVANHLRAEIGYWVAPWARGRGVATAAVRLLAGYGFDTLGLGRIGITAEPRNEASCHVAEAAGFAAEGVLRGWLIQGGERRDAVSYGLLRENRLPKID